MNNDVLIIRIKEKLRRIHGCSFTFHSWDGNDYEAIIIVKKGTTEASVKPLEPSRVLKTINRINPLDPKFCFTHYGNIPRGWNIYSQVVQFEKEIDGITAAINNKTVFNQSNYGGGNAKCPFA